MKINKAPSGMPVESWAVVAPEGIVVGGFDTPEAAQAWATEWNSCKHGAYIAPICHRGTATEALAAYERHAQGLGALFVYWGTQKQS